MTHRPDLIRQLAREEASEVMGAGGPPASGGPTQAAFDAHVGASSPHPGAATTGQLAAAIAGVTPASIGAATPSEVASAVAAHAGSATPHSGHATTAALDAHTGAANPHSGSASTTALSAHTSAANPHSGSCASNDPRLSDARPPTSHGASHATTDVIPAATGSAPGLMSAADKQKLDGLGSSGVVVRATANVPNATTTLANITGLSATLLPNTVYSFRVCFGYTTSATTVGLQLGMAFTGTTTAIRYGLMMGTSATAMQIGHAAAAATKVGPTNVGPGATARTGVLEGVIRVGASGGTLNAQLCAGVAGTATILADAWMEVRPF